MEHASKDSSTKGSSSTRSIYTDGSEPLPLIPGLRRFYEKAAPLAWPIIRFAVSWPLIYRGYHKWSIGLDDAVAPFIALGLKHPVPLAIMSTGLELFGGLGLLLGLFTRFWAAAIALEMAYITFFLYRSEEHTSELQSLMRISYAVFCLKKKKTNKRSTTTTADSHL